MAGSHTRSHRVPAFAAVAVAACAALTSCGDGSETAGPSSSAPATSATVPTTGSPAKDSPAEEKLVLRWRETGGIAGLGGPGSVPEFSLFSTGRAVVSSGPPQYELTEYRLKPEALRRLLDEARDAGLGRSHTVGSDRIMDAIIAEITMGDATTRVIQPGSESASAPEARFLKRLDPRSWPASDQAAPPKPYRPEKTAVLAGETSGGAKVKNWPLAPLARGEEAAGALCTVVPASKLPATAPDTVWRSEGKTYSVRLRPLLPAESTCQDVI
ncbi:hypothetical protein D0T12_16035 [Actinomadura spongiicola]|uniref:Lipoprotein n=1 Tax=Actinomadura spongiicola TaxID=2303421 RepID=A0A372GI10_9ACTN|nr:hypothetical protein [Actinomadura spongiicola]RFS84997.1 hypothetical protein D0T12_16035 [Actinomadura spongiicola]